MGARLQRLLNELDETYAHRRCPHGGVAYPPWWNTKTQASAIETGVLSVCQCEPSGPWLKGWRYLIVRAV